MKFTVSWLREHLEIDGIVDLSTLERTLNNIGLEVEKIMDKSKLYKDFIIAEIIDAKQHPDADRLRLCLVDNGTQKLQIVCGAPNARIGIKVVLAPIGCTLPSNGVHIKKSKIRGVESNGMLCSGEELGLSEDGSGIVELPEEAVVGESFAEFAGLNDQVVELSITPNRGDCLGVYGIARELAAAGFGRLKPIEVADINPELDMFPDISIETESCKSFASVYIAGAKNCPSPSWMQTRLKAIGEKPISALVDITNYIMFTYGKPMHAYDAKVIGMNMTIKDINSKHEMKALSGDELKIPEGATVITGKSGEVLGLAGIVGSIDSGCYENTTDIILESADFDCIGISETSRSIGVVTGASYRFERQIDPEFVIPSIKIAAKLIREICGGKIGKLVYKGIIPKHKQIKFDLKKAEKLVGINMKVDEVKKILSDLGFICQGNGNILELVVPSWRNDIAHDYDITEEIVRISGLDNLPNHSINEDFSFNIIYDSYHRRVASIKRLLANRGLNECICWSFTDRKYAELFKPADDHLIDLANPISSELATMRPSLIPNLLIAFKDNAMRGNDSLALFEVGEIFSREYKLMQKQVVCGIRVGGYLHPNVYKTERETDIFDAKADMIAVLEDMDMDVSKLEITDKNKPEYYHPARYGEIALGKNMIGRFGELHPIVTKEIGIKQRVMCFEVIIEEVPYKKQELGRKGKVKFSQYQAVKRDFAFICNENLRISEVERLVRKQDKKLIRSMNFFDIYTGGNIEYGKKSVAFSVIFQADDRTLKSEELEIISDAIVKAMEDQLDAKLR